MSGNHLVRPSVLAVATQLTQIAHAMRGPGISAWASASIPRVMATLDSVVPVGRVLKGKGQAPLQPSFVEGNSGSYESGDDIEVTWGLLTGPVSAGAGLQEAGDAVPALDAPGQVEVSLVGTSYVEVIPATSLSHTISSADLLSALGSHASATVRVRHIANGLISENRQKLVEAV